MQKYHFIIERLLREREAFLSGKEELCFVIMNLKLCTDI